MNQIYNCLGEIIKYFQQSGFFKQIYEHLKIEIIYFWKANEGYKISKHLYLFQLKERLLKMEIKWNGKIQKTEEKLCYSDLLNCICIDPKYPPEKVNQHRNTWLQIHCITFRFQQWSTVIRRKSFSFNSHNLSTYL